LLSIFVISIIDSAMRTRTSPPTLIVVLTAAVLLPAAVNVATGALPDDWRPWLWLAWPVAAVLAVPVVVAELRRPSRAVLEAGDAPAEADSGETTWNIPLHLPTFREREVILDEVALLVAKNDGPIVLTGMAGVGKTQLAARYAARHRPDFEIGWWVPAETRVAMIASLAQLADRLGIGDEDQEEAARKALRSLEGRGRWLLVFDNVTEERDVTGLIPAGGQVLMTSRDPNQQRLGAVVEVPTFDNAAAVRFLLERTGSDDRNAAAELAAELGGLPLALEQAAAYCTSAVVTLADYLPRYREDHDRLLRMGLPDDRLTAGATLALAIRQAANRDRAAMQLLRLCSFLASSAGIPRWLYDSHPELLPKPLGTRAVKKVDLDRTITVLVALSLVQREGWMLRIHPVVQDVTRDHLSEDGRLGTVHRAMQSRLPLSGTDHAADWDRERWILLAGEVIGAALPADPADPAGWDRWVVALPHALRVLQHAAGIVAAPTAALRHRTGAYLLHRAEFTLATDMLEAAIAEQTKVLGADHPATLTARNDRARVLIEVGKLAEGAVAHEEVRAARLRALGPEHRDTLISMNNVAFAWARQGRLDDARALHEQTLRTRQRVVGPEHPDTLISMGNLALVLAEQGLFAQARELHEQSLAMRRKLLGDNHPAVLESANNLAIVVSEMGDLDLARRLYDQTLAVRRELLGDDHPDTLMSVNNLAFVLALQGDLGRARELHEQTLTARRRVSGPEHPHTLITMNNLALVLAAQGHWAEAHSIHSETLAVRRRILGPEHPYSLHSQNNLAIVLAAEGQLADAARMAEETLEVRRRRLGPEHPHTLNSMNNLALIRAAQGRMEPARELVARTLEIRRRLLGPEHPDTRRSVLNLSRLDSAENTAGLVAEPT
jgi:tetratricopeptide (TPR) repeat protein